MKPIKLGKIKDQLSEGDIVFVRTDTPIGWVIRMRTRSAVNHVGILTKKAGSKDDKLYIAEMVPSGIVYSDLDKYDSEWRFWEYVYKVKFSQTIYDIHTNKRILRNWIDFLVNEINVDYDFQEIVSFLFDKKDNDHTDMVCSKLVFNLLLLTESLTDYTQYRYYEDGMPLKSLLVSPGDLYKDTNLYDISIRRN